MDKEDEKILDRLNELMTDLSSCFTADETREIHDCIHKYWELTVAYDYIIYMIRALNRPITANIKCHMIELYDWYADSSEFTLDELKLVLE